MEDMDDEEIRQSVQNADLKQILQLLKREAQKGSVSSMKRVLKVIPAGKQGHTARLEVFRLTLSLLQGDDLDPKAASQLLALLHTQIPGVPVSELTRVVERLMDAVEEGLPPRGRWLEAVPQLMCRVGSCATVSQSDGTVLSGPRWKRRVLEGLCSCAWEPEWVAPLARLFGELQMDDSELAYAVDRLVGVLPRLELTEAASLAYRLLLLSDRDRLPTVLDATIRFLNEDDRTHGDSQERRRARGDVVLHVALATRQNLDVGRCLVRLLKEKRPSFVLSKFALALALALAKTDPLAEQLLQVLKGVVTLTTRKREEVKGSLWVRSLCKESLNAERCILDVADCSLHGGGWLEIVQGLVRFAFLLLEGRQGAEMFVPLATGILVQTFEANPAAHRAILGSLMVRLSAAESHYDEIFVKLVAGCSRSVFREEAKLTELLGRLWRLPWRRAARLLETVSPLAGESTSFPDTAMILLRKTAFGRDKEARLVSASGCIVLLRNLDLALHGKVGAELLSLVGRCLSQEAQVRRVLYEGLPGTVRRNPGLFADVAQLLWQKLVRYLPSEEDSLPPVKVAEAVQVSKDEAVLLEPLGHLVLCAHRCLTAVEAGGQTASESAATRLADVLETLSRRLVSAEPQDFGLEKTADCGGTGAAERNALVAVQLQALCEALMERLPLNSSHGDTREMLFSLFTKVEQLSTTRPKKDAAPRRSARPAPCLLGPDFAADLLRHVFLSGEDSSQGDNDDAFARYVVARAAGLATETPDRDSAFDSLDPEASLRPRFRIARAFLEIYEERVTTGPASLTGACIRSIDGLFSAVCQQHKELVPTFLSELEHCSKATREDLAEKQMRRYRDLAGQLLTLPGESRIGELAHLASICTALCPFVDADGSFLRDFQSWIRNICVQQSPGDVAVCKNLLALLFTASRQTKACMEVLHEVAVDVRLQLGTVDEDAEPSSAATYAAVTSRAHVSVLAVLLDHLQGALQRVDWVLTLLRESSKDSGPDETEATRMEVAVCRHLGYLVTIFAELSRSRLPRSPARTTLLQLTKLYGCLASLSKYYVALYKRKVGRLCSKFEKLVRLAGTHLTPHIYALITFLQSPEAQKFKGKRKAKVGGKEATPGLIFAIERHENLLILLGKKAKVNLTEGCKMSTARDFRIDAAGVQAALRRPASETAENGRSPKRTRTEDED